MVSRVILSLLFLAIHAIIVAQSDHAKILVKCMDYQDKLLSGEQIWFQVKNSTKLYKGITDVHGSFVIELKGSETYLILVKSVGDALNYSEISIPTLKEGESYGDMEIIVKINPPKEFTLDHVFFETGKSSLKKESFAELDELFELMNVKPNLEIEIAGHTDDVGNEQSNLSLSQKRSETVKLYLVNKGIPDHRIIAKGYGESQPIAGNNTEEGRQMNRRTQVKVLKE